MRGVGIPCQKSPKVALGNIYLTHVLAFLRGTTVPSLNGDREPDEALMRYVEWEAAIPENKCFAFRSLVAEQYAAHRMDALYGKVGYVLSFIALYEQRLATEWMTMYPDCLKQVKV